MLGAIIDDKENGLLTHVFIDINDSYYKVNGFSISENKILRIKEEILKYFEFFILGNNKMSLGKSNQYDIFLDIDTGLYHFLKDGIEDYNMLFRMNGSVALCSLCNSRLDKQKSEIRKFRFRLVTLYVSEIVLSLNLIFKLLGESYSIPFMSERIEFSSAMSYAISVNEYDKFSMPIDLNMIRDYIYSSSCITNDEEKDFLFK